ncbi:MAG: hypothetical protein JXA13_01085 [Anaerolineales bacterium]|nr:hypothetical protein [Anaerolineales bacterium]
MRGGIVVVEEHYRNAAKLIFPQSIPKSTDKGSRYTVTGMSKAGSGKSETGQAIAEELHRPEIKAVILGQNDYFALPSQTNDARRQAGSEWLRPCVDARVFIARDRLDTLEYRQKCGQGHEVGDPFVEQSLETENKFITGHKQLSGFVITIDYDAVVVE